MMYRGTLSEFESWHSDAMQAEGITLPDGKIGYVNGVLAPQNQHTTAYSMAIQNPDKSDDYIWQYGKYPIQNKTILTQVDIDNLGWFQ